jgi:hypothetical protein
LINVFTVEPDRAAELAALLHTATQEVMRHQPGFRSATASHGVVDFGSAWIHTW